MSTTTQPTQLGADRRQWWQAARFGLFIHWGPVSLVDTEIGWSRGGADHARRHDQPTAGRSSPD